MQEYERNFSSPQKPTKARSTNDGESNSVESDTNSHGKSNVSTSNDLDISNIYAI